MKLTWDENSSAYNAVAKVVLNKYEYRDESIVVQLKLKYKCEKEYTTITELLINESDHNNSNWIWEYDWWEGQEDVELIAFKPVSDINLVT